MDALSGIGGFASFLLGLSALTSSVPEQPRIRFVSANEIPKLGDVIIKRRPWYAFLSEDPNFDDRIYSILVIGIPGTRVEFFNDTNFKDGTTSPSSDQGRYTVEISVELFAAIRTLDASSKSKPVTFPPNRVVAFEKDDSDDNDGKWHTDLSSVRFDQTWLANVAHAPQAKDPVLRCAPVAGGSAPRPRPRTARRGAARS